MPYLCYKDSANAKSNQQHLGTIKSSNLCTEIIEYSSPTETAVCNLGSLSLPKFVIGGLEDGEWVEPVFDFTNLRKYTQVLCKNLDIVIDKTYYPTPECKTSNMRHRPIGIGVQGLADVFAKMRIPWTSDAAKKLNREIFENIYFAALTASYNRSMDLSYQTHLGMVEPGCHSSFSGSPLSRGILQVDMWKDDPITKYLDWVGLRRKVKEGVRNSLLVAPMPTASTAQILGNNECFEPFTSNMYTRRVLAGDFIVINKHLIAELTNLDLWNTDMRANLIANNGSVSSLNIPTNLKEIYKTVWEIPQKTLIDMSADRAPFICQSQSLNLFVGAPNYAKLTSMHFYAWKKGLKTGCYYLRTKGASAPQQFTVEPCSMCTA
jgi:ribonucleoside-diphosphate reductase alpha chain